MQILNLPQIPKAVNVGACNQMSPVWKLSTWCCYDQSIIENIKYLSDIYYIQSSSLSVMTNSIANQKWKICHSRFAMLNEQYIFIIIHTRVPFTTLIWRSVSIEEYVTRGWKLRLLSTSLTEYLRRVLSMLFAYTYRNPENCTPATDTNRQNIHCCRPEDWRKF